MKDTKSFHIKSYAHACLVNNKPKDKTLKDFASLIIALGINEWQKTHPPKPKKITQNQEKRKT